MGGQVSNGVVGELVDDHPPKKHAEPCTVRLTFFHDIWNILIALLAMPLHAYLEEVVRYWTLKVVSIFLLSFRS